MTSSGTEPETSACSIVSQPTSLPLAPPPFYSGSIVIWRMVEVGGKRYNLKMALTIIITCNKTFIMHCKRLKAEQLLFQFLVTMQGSEMSCDVTSL
jgi:hypothetical protein